ncbi:HTH-type transcriptional activator CmpR [Serratia proteamaculans]|uniref:LysR family transcriptional regulator n=1 Tax=Serratia proteamaculans TaxID=28151 RepID=UPI00217B9600|nr:LysR family transcriptional regulator [Serratia proteamaculans]CAI0898182.1 HTH-type transcriptional activator CmpR [Serratia proteamaculans]CAI1780518.1 HTH-type transcriptional activator CmpR [Serratia proteamaculans]
MGKLNLDQLQTFAQVIKQGSFSGAGATLGLTQPAVSLQIRQLERSLNVKLIERVAKRIRPTAAGAVLLGHRHRINSAVDEALSDMANHASNIMGNVILGTGATACIHLLPPILRELKHSYPMLTVGVRTGNTDDMVRAVEENRLDIALVTLPASGRNVLITPILQDEFVAIFPAADPSLPMTFSPDALSAYPFVVFESGSSTRLLIDDWFRQAGSSNNPIMELGSIEAIKEMVSAGLGFSIVPRMALAGNTENPGIIQRSLSPSLERTLGIALRQDKPLTKGLQKVINRLNNLQR